MDAGDASSLYESFLVFAVCSSLNSTNFRLRSAFFQNVIPSERSESRNLLFCLTQPKQILRLRKGSATSG